MQVIAFTHNVTDPSELITIESWLATLCADVKLFNIPNHKMEDHVKSGMAVVTLGRIASITLQQVVNEKKIQNVRHVSLPQIKSLAPKPENKEARAEAMNKLKELKAFIELDIYQPQVVLVSESDIPDLDAKHLLMLQKMTEAAGKNSCFQCTKNGRLIEISTTHLENSKADVHLTFHEVYTIKTLMDVLKVTEVELVSYTQPNSSGGNK
jgi:hypothetical protein